MLETMAARATARAARTTRISEEDHGHARVGAKIARGPFESSRASSVLPVKNSIRSVEFRPVCEVIQSGNFR